MVRVVLGSCGSGGAAVAAVVMAAAGSQHLLVQLEIVSDLLERIGELLGVIMHLRAEAARVDLDLPRRHQQPKAANDREKSHGAKYCIHGVL